MKLYSAESNKAILKDIGTRLKERRISFYYAKGTLRVKWCFFKERY